MQDTQVITVEESGAAFLPINVLEAIGVKAGDKIEVSISEHSIVVRSVAEAEREREIKASAKKIFERHHTAFERLAEGAR